MLKIIINSQKISLALFVLLCSFQILFSQESLVDVNTDRFYQLESNLVKNTELLVTTDKDIKEAGLEIQQIGFRKNSFTLKNELFVQFKCEKGAEMELGAVLFDNDRLAYWESSFKGLRQPEQYNLFYITFPFDSIDLKAESVLTLWAKTPVSIHPYQMWEWTDQPKSEWLKPIQAISVAAILDEKIEDVVYEVYEVDEAPQFPGGEAAKLQFISDHIKYPKETNNGTVQGMVVVEFTVRSDGSLDDFNILRDLGYGCGTEAVRVLKSMPNWIAGQKEGEAVSVRVRIPIRFI